MSIRRRTLGAFPRAWSDQQVPTWPVEIDPSGPLAGAAGVWLLNDGRAVDLTGSGNNAAPIGAPVVVIGPFGPCTSFNGTSQYFRIPNPTPAALQLQAQSWSARVLWNGAGTGMIWATFLSGAGAGINGGVNWSVNGASNSKLSVAWCSPTAIRGFYSSSYVMPSSQWVEIGGWLDPTTGQAKAFANGVSQGTFATIVDSINYSNSTDFEIGSNRQGTGGYWNGQMSRLVIASGVQPDSWFAALYAAPFAGFRPAVRRTYYTASLSSLTNLTSYFTAPGDSLIDAKALAIGGADVLSDTAAASGMGLDALIAGTAINLGATESLTRATAIGTASGDWHAAATALHTAAGDWLLSTTATATGLLDTLGTAITNLTAHDVAALDWLAGGSAQATAAADTTAAVAAHASAASDWLSSGTAQATAAAGALTAATAYATGLADSLGTGSINLTAFGSGALEWTAGGVSLTGVPFTWGAFILATATTVPACARTTTVPAFTRTTTVPRY